MYLRLGSLPSAEGHLGSDGTHSGPICPQPCDSETHVLMVGSTCDSSGWMIISNFETIGIEFTPTQVLHTHTVAFLAGLIISASFDCRSPSLHPSGKVCSRSRVPGLHLGWLRHGRQIRANGVRIGISATLLPHCGLIDSQWKRSCQG